jgi:uncharacterized cupin superfamily protein
MKIEVHKPTPQEEALARTWSTWSCPASTFDWHYDDMETCLILEGQVTVEGGGQSVSFKAGDWVVFPQGLDCTWKVSKAVKKHYKFG